MAAHALTGLADLMPLLTSARPGDVVIEGLVTGPLAGFSAVAGILMHGVGDELVMVGSYGYSPGDLAGFETMPIAADLPICQAYRDGEVVVTSTAVAEDDYADLGDDPTRWTEFRERTPRGSLVALPLISQGVAIGCVGFSCGEERDWGPASIGLLDCVSSIVAMWMAHPVSGLAPASVWVAAEPITLSSRQLQMLQLCSAGLSNSEIASALAYSESTVKQEMRRILRAFETSDRAIAVLRARALGLLAGGGE